MKTIFCLVLLLSFAQADNVVKSISLDEFASVLKVLTGESPVPNHTKEVFIRDRYSQKGLKLAADFIKDRLQLSGYQVTKESFEGWDRDGSSQGVNIIAELPGSQHPEEIILLGAHYDTTGHERPGANDNGSGVAGVLAIAKAMKDTGFTPARTIRFVLFDLEEAGLEGSRYHFDQALLKREKIKLFVNVDMIGHSPTGLPYATLDVGIGNIHHNLLRPYVEQVKQDAGIELKLDSWEGYASDNRSGLRVGIPSISIFEDPREPDHSESEYDRNNHSKRDKYDQVNIRYATLLTRLIGAVVTESSRTRLSWDLPSRVEKETERLEKLERKGLSRARCTILGLDN